VTMKTLQVLVVDDHTIFRSGVRRLLEDEADMRVAAEASNGGEALDLVRARTFDVVLLDINMEGRSGLEVLARLRESGSHREVPVLVVTAVAESSPALAGFEVHEVLHKPVDAPALLAALQRAGVPPHPATTEAGG